jgi:hypothetical protein
MDARTEELHKKIQALSDELSSHANVIDDPQCAALCETSAEAMGGLSTAFDHFKNRSEKAWQK